MRRGRALLAGVLAAGLALSAKAESAIDAAAVARASGPPPLGLPPALAPGETPPSAGEVALGRKLFLDRRLSANGTMSCAVCHVPEQGFTSNELATAIGVEGRSGRRNAPTLINIAYAPVLFHDGRERALETQIISPLLAHNEMANPSIGWTLQTIEDLADYDGLFEAAYGSGPSIAAMGSALAAWQRTLIAGASPFDRWRYGGEADAVNDEVKRGFALFTGKAGCAACHLVGETHALFTDWAYHDTGLGRAGPPKGPVRVRLAPGVFADVSAEDLAQLPDARQPDRGRMEATYDPADAWAFRTAPLRNVALTAPYMHDGSLLTLEAVIAFYDRGGGVEEGDVSDPGSELAPLGLSPEERAALAAFLRALTSPAVEALIRDARSAPIGRR